MVFFRPQALSVLISLGLVVNAGLVSASQPAASHAIAMHGDLKYGPDFQHFEYTNPGAPKGGAVRQAQTGTFDTLNPFTLKGVSAANLGLLFDTLTEHADDEPFSEYGRLAETIEVPEDRSWVAYTLREAARFHDGTPVTPDDVIFSMETLKSKGHPFYRAYYANVVKGEKVGPRKVKFHFGQGENRELALIVGQIPVLSKAYWSGRDFEKTTREPPLGSGPYRVASVDPGRSITYERDPEYWGADLPVNRGRHNFDTLRIDYYRDDTVALQAFKAGEYDVRQELTAKNWATAYDIPAVRSGVIKLDEIAHESPTGMQAFVFNIRRPIFQDRRVREALAYAFDFEWTNKNLFHNAYTRTTSYFSNSELAARGLPSPEEQKILEPYRDHLPEEVFTQAYRPPSTDGSGNIRENLRKAMRLLSEAGWVIENRKLAHKESGVPLEFEILLVQSDFERVVLPFIRNLERLGVGARVRTVDSAQYQNRLRGFDFDMVVGSFGQSLSPGNEQRDFWSSEKADVKGSRNLMGIQDKVVDELIELVISAPDRDSLVQRTRALDRVLLWGHYLIPNWHVRSFRMAYWDRFGRPKIAPKYALGFQTWWVDAAAAKRVDAYLGAAR